MANKRLASKKLDSIEQSFLALDSINTSQVISVLCLLEKPIEEKLFRAKFEELIPDFARLKCILKDPFWVEDPNFNPQDNVFFIRPPKKTIFKEVCEQTFSHALNPKLPPWKIIIVQSQPTAAHFIFHHSFSDGMGIIEFIKTLCRKKISGKNTPAEMVLGPNKNTVKIKQEAIKVLAKDFIKKRCFSPINGKNSDLRKCDFLNLSLTEINTNRKQYQVSLHEYMLGLVCTGLNTYFKEKNFKLDTLSVLTPVSHRHPKSSLPFGNYLTGMAIDLDLSQKDPELRLNEIKNKFRSSIEQRKDQVYIYLAHTVARLPNLIRKILCNFSATRTNLICTSVPSSGKDTLELLGSKITHKYGMAALMKGHGLSLAFTRYLDSMCICIVSDPKIVKDPELILKYINDAHQEFCNWQTKTNQRGILNA